MPGSQAFIFDLNGTMIDDMQYHSAAWFSILNDDLKAGLTREEVNLQMYGKNEELLDRIFGKGHFTKEENGRDLLPKRTGLPDRFPPLSASDRRPPGPPGKGQPPPYPPGHRLGRRIPFNIDFVLDNLHIRPYFQAIVSADDVTISKPDPETFVKAARILGVPPETCIVFEDAPKGVEAALRAGMSSIVLTTMHEKEDFLRYPNVLRYIADYTDPSLDELFT